MLLIWLRKQVMKYTENFFFFENIFERTNSDFLFINKPKKERKRAESRSGLSPNGMDKTPISEPFIQPHDKVFF